jgi:hypothetical protein
MHGATMRTSIKLVVFVKTMVHSFGYIISYPVVHTFWANLVTLGILFI